MYGFVVIEDIVFGKNTSLVVDPSEEKLKTEFENVKRFYIPDWYVYYDDEGNIKQFPSGNFPIPPSPNNTEN